MIRDVFPVLRFCREQLLASFFLSQSVHEFSVGFPRCPRVQKCAIATASASQALPEYPRKQMKIEKVLTLSTLNPHIASTDYTPDADLNEIADKLEREQRKGIPQTVPFLIRANCDDPKAHGQQPITFVRQLIASACLPSLDKHSLVPEDVQRKSKEFLADCGGGSMGSYSDFRGIEGLRKQIAKYIELRDGIPTNHDSIHCMTGAEHSVRDVLKLFINENASLPQGVMCPNPGESLLAPALSEYGLEMVGYPMCDSRGWQIDDRALEKAYTEKNNRCDIRVLYICNPGNPTGQVLTRQSLETVVRFAHKHRLFILANEEYQESILDASLQFIACRQVIATMEAPFNSVELASVNSCSYGYIGEAGHGGSYVEFHNVDIEVADQFRKMEGSWIICSLQAQATLFAMFNPPEPTEPSYALWRKETDEIEQAMRSSAKILMDGLNRIKGIECRKVEGGRFAYPSIDIPLAACERATELGISPCHLYATQLLKEEGVLVSPGHLFSSPKNKFHLRIVVLPRLDHMKTLVERLTLFHERFTIRYGTYGGKDQSIVEESMVQAISYYG